MPTGRSYRMLARSVGAAGAARRAVRRGARQSLYLAVQRGTYEWSRKEPQWDFEVAYDWEDDFYMEPTHVTWRMTTPPFRLIPSWVPLGAEEEYERHQALWLLAGERLCPSFGVPVSLCRGLTELVARLVAFSDGDAVLVYRCQHD